MLAQERRHVKAFLIGSKGSRQANSGVDLSQQPKRF
jgi:hypothetical protein